MSHHLHNEACPSCRKDGNDRSGDNLGVYSDGHKYCFKCGHHESSSGIVRFLSQETYDEVRHEVHLPIDVSTTYPYKALEWIQSYELTANDLLQHNVLWSESRSRLIFPIYGDESLIAWQGRYFGEKQEVKWFGIGDLKNTFNILSGKSGRSTLVLTEDIISAIKVSKVCPAMPLYGNAVGFERFKRLQKLMGYGYDVRIWLDPDMRTHSVKEARRGAVCGLTTTVVFSEVDPKELTIEEIKGYL